MSLSTRTARVVALTALLGLPVAIPTASADESLDYRVASWDRNSGLPSGGITALVAAPDGALWVGMDTGLYRFDGLRFVRLNDWAGGVAYLKTTSDGSLWVATADGRVIRLQNGRRTVFDQQHGLPGATATVLVEDSARRLWLGTRSGLFLLTEDRWTLATPMGLPTPLRVSGATVDSSGNLLLSANSALFRRDANSDAFRQLATFKTAGGLSGICAVAPDRIYVTDPTQGFVVVGTRGGPRSPARSVGARMMCDRRGNVWIGTGGSGLWRIPPSENGSQPDVVTGMFGEVASALAEDSRGNIWVGTPAGLKRLSPNPMVRLADIGVTTSVETTPDGHLWVGTLDGLLELTTTKSGAHEHARFLPGLRVRALHADGAAALWVATEAGVSRLDLRTRRVANLPVALHQVDSLSPDRDGHIWIADGMQGLVTWDGRTLAPVLLPFDVRENQVQVLHIDRHGRTWLALDTGAAVIDRDGSVRVYSDAGRGRTARRSRSIFEDSRGVIWIGGIDSLTWFSGDEHHTVTQADGFPVDFVKGLGVDGGGDMWLAGDAAIVRISRAEFERSTQTRARPLNVRYMRFDENDGAGTPRLLGDRSVVQAPNGMLWFITGNTVTGIDPELPSFHDTTTPKADVVSALTDGRTLETMNDARFSSRTRGLQIDYTALNIDSPHHTRFRYRLRGFDDEWQDAGARMTAFYTNLPPGQYNFEVAASNQIHTWGEPTASWRFHVAPVFYQTRWFPVVCGGLIALAGWGIWCLRLAQVRQQFAIVLGERVRLSREIHDTLLQSLVGVAVQCEVLAREVEKSPGTARETLVRLRRQVEGHIREFRQAISDLRAERDDFITAIRTAGETAERVSGVQFDMVVRGRPRPSPEEVERQLIKIAREAVSNAARHARARSISVELGYDDTALTLLVKDDGLGFDPEEESLRPSDGHCGLVTMRERAAEIGGYLSISSVFGKGTQVEATVPLRAA